MVFKTLHLLPLALFAGLMLLAAEQDLREQRIANKLCLLLVALVPAHLMAGTAAAAASALALGTVTFLVGFFAFTHGWVGGGDVKLLAAAALWAGPDGAMALFVIAAVVGGLGAVAALLIRLRRRHSLRAALRHPMPYGPAIAAGALVAVFGTSGLA